ncbi:Double zinc ribbon [Treponema berlinense]|uniref:Double zinc ribbon n=1 Tax=Treponema berlinense TaxID=225004 RepID=A0A1T4LTV1_9SPIR|nr:zinc-ribbon domain-containing protein [Treponema berlinense]SJZ58105.1 Double zinc ribbon [Treponema berlinense]
MANCTNCGAELNENQKFCSECGTPVNQKCVCQNCGIKLKSGTKFCPECGTAQSENHVNKTNDNLSTLERINFEKASKEFLTSTNNERLLGLIKPVYEKHPHNEEVLSLYLRILLDADFEEAKNVLERITDEYLDVYFCKIKACMLDDEFSEAEELLDKADTKWSENKILKYLRTELLLRIGAKTENQECIADGLELLCNTENPENKREESECRKIFVVIDDLELYDDEFILEFVKKIAEKGNICAQSYLGFIGTEDEQNYEVAWCKKAAVQGYAEAQSTLGRRYLHGYGVDRNYKEAVKWYRKAAEQNYASAQYALGELLENGCGIEYDYNQAIEWYKKAANQGNKGAQEALERLGE